MAKQEVKQVRTIKSREELIEDIINAGKSIINNADSILGNEKYFLKCSYFERDNLLRKGEEEYEKESFGYLTGGNNGSKLISRLWNNS